MEACEACDGRGTVAGNVICQPCTGLGVSRCGFCDGSGLVTYNIVPSGLRLAVLTNRVNMALSRVEELFQKPVPQNSAADPIAVAKRCAKQILSLNRELGVFENAVVTAKDLIRTHPSSKGKITKIIGSYCRTAAAAYERIRKLAEQVGESSKAQAETPGVDSAVRDRAKKGAEFYDALAKSKKFNGTSLEHPYLWRSLANLSRKTRKGRPASKESQPGGGQ
jgi:hypothetical protein